MHASRKRQLRIDLGLAAASWGMVATGLLACWTHQMAFWLEDITVSGYRDCVVSAIGVGTVGLLLSLLVGVVFGASRWVYLVPIAGCVVLGLVAAEGVSGMAGAALEGEPFDGWDSALSSVVAPILLSPTGWPLCLLAGAAVLKVLRERWCPGPRPAPDRSSAPSPRSSAGS